VHPPSFFRVLYLDIRRKTVVEAPLVIRDDPTGEFGPGNARWQVAKWYRRRLLAAVLRGLPHF
jgi:hypothetical protein